MAVITIIDPILGLYQKLGDSNEAASFNIAAGVTTTGISGSGGGGGVTVIADGGTLTGTYQGDVLCEGSATLAGNVTVQGKLTVLSDLVNDGGHELTVNGDLIVNNDFLFDHSNPDAVQSNMPVILKLGTMPTKKKLNNSDNAETVDITAISGGLDGNIFSYGITGGEWYYHTGISLTPP